MAKAPNRPQAVQPADPAVQAAQAVRALVSAGRIKEALGAGDRAAAAHPRSAPVWEAFSLALEKAGDMEKSAAAMNMACGQALENHTLWCELARLCIAINRFQDALAAASRACDLAPDNPVGWMRRGLAARRMNDRMLAVKCFDRAYKLAPDQDVHVVNLFNILAETGSPQALDIMKQNVALADRSRDFAHASAFALVKMGHTVEAAEWGLRAAAHSFTGAEAEAVRHGLRSDGYLSDDCAALLKDWTPEADHRNSAGTLASLLFVLGNYEVGFSLFRKIMEGGDKNDGILFYAPFADSLTAEDIQDVYRLYYRMRDARPIAFDPPLTPARKARRRLRVGYVSPDFRQHVCRHFYLPLLANHDRECFEVFAYSTTWQRDHVSERIAGLVDHWLDVSRMDEDAIADRVRADEIDILVNLAGHTQDGRLDVFERRPAPVQVYWMGSLFTTGSPNCDYYVGDRISTPPEADRLFSETVARLPHLWAAYDPDKPLPDLVPPPSRDNGHVTFACFSNIVRLNNRVLGLWADILNQLPGARLRLFSSQLTDERTQETMRARFAAAGFDPARLDFGYTKTPLEAMNGVDINLDCFPRNSATTTFEALAMGVPTVTVCDRPPEGRVGTAILNAIGLPDLVAYSDREYVAKCVRLAQDEERRAELRRTLRERATHSVLWDGPGFARRMEDAYRAMWRTATGADDTATDAPVLNEDLVP